ncbi:MAG: ribose 5-phosphate isomerase B [Bryobacteraceae bacterium]|nr:ribose 5-phosphate isomerase B [Bryobacteraceae bacterium]MCX7604113.1 ribose 5-phosphate isomerase B [Bryobacteraceae bacterium]
MIEAMRRVVTERDLPAQGVFRVERGALWTPSARDLARERGLEILELDADELAAAEPERTIAIGADHGGFALKERLKPLLAELGWHVDDVGVYEEKTADYPDIAHAVALRVAEGRAALGVIVDGAGIGSAMAANKVPGIRAALCYDRASARNSREHNHANVLTLGGRMLTPSQAEEVVRTWLATPCGGGRHAARAAKITEIERRYSSWTPQNSKG